MNSKILKFSIIMISTIFLISSLALAGGKGKNKSKSTPPGWEQGEKTGWKGEEKPPGLTEEKIEKKHKTKMKKGDQDKEDEVKEKAEKNAFKLDEDLKVLDVEYPGDQKVESGRADILFFAKGYSDRAIIHMADSDARFSFQIEPFLSNVKLYDAYTGFEE